MKQYKLVYIAAIYAALYSSSTFANPKSNLDVKTIKASEPSNINAKTSADATKLLQTQTQTQTQILTKDLKNLKAENKKKSEKIKNLKNSEAPTPQLKIDAKQPLEPKPLQPQALKAPQPQPLQQPQQAIISSNTVSVAQVMQAVKPKPQPLSELLNQALNYNTEFLAEKLEQDALYERSHQAKAAFLPSVRWNTNAQLGYQDPKNEPGFSTRGVNTTLNVQQTIYQADRFIALDQAKITRELAPTNLAIAKQGLWLKIVQNYFGILKQIKTLETLEKKQKSIEQQRMYAQKSFDAGLTSITDVREAQSRLDNLLAQKITAQNQIDSQKKQLEILTGADPKILQLPEFKIDVQKIESYRQKVLKETDLTRLDLLKIPAINAARLNTLLAEKEYEKAKKADYPTLEAYANAGYNTSDGSNQKQNYQKSAALGLQLSVPLFTGTAKGIKKREMALLLNKAQQSSLGVQRSWQERYVLTMQNLDSLISQNKALLSAMQSNQANLNATQLAYKVGLRINIDVLNAQDQLYETQKQLSQNEYDLLISVLELNSHLNQLQDQTHLAFVKNEAA